MPDTSLSIGEVINLLREEFPDLSVSKVRFLESQGLLAPGRTEGGYRQFDQDDVDRLRYVLRQQRDHFLPLKVIKSKLTLWERGEETIDDGSPAPDLLDQPGEPVTRGELLRRSGLTGSQLDSLATHGLLEPVDGELFPPWALVVATEAARLLAQGLEARHLRAVRHAAEREADILAQLTAALRRIPTPEAQARVRNILAGCGEALVAIHQVLVGQQLRRLLDR